MSVKIPAAFFARSCIHTHINVWICIFTYLSVDSCSATRLLIMPVLCPGVFWQSGPVSRGSGTRPGSHRLSFFRPFSDPAGRRRGPGRSAPAWGSAAKPSLDGQDGVHFKWRREGLTHKGSSYWKDGESRKCFAETGRNHNHPKW